MAVFCDRYMALVADNEDAGCGFDDVVCDGLEFVDLEDSGYLCVTCGENWRGRRGS